jgi:osmotically-inducible protein OsmY
VAQNVTEARQETQIWTTYALSPYLRAHDLKVAVHGDKATLTGNVDEGVNKDLAKQIALGVEGIKEVDNQIVVMSDYTPPVWASTRTYGEAIDDATITAAVKSKLVWSKNVDGLAATVETKSGKVTLKGTADSTASSNFATRLAMNTHGVLMVDNQLVVNAAKPDLAQSAKSTVNAAEHEIKDSWITAKVKSTFMYSSHVEGSHIDVSTINGVVTLTGKVDSGAERALAIELADNVRGVKQVQASGLVF